MLASIRANSEVDYKVIYVAEDNAANCIWINDTLICRGGTRGHNVLSACRPGGNSQVRLEAMYKFRRLAECYHRINKRRNSLGDLPH